MTTSPWLRKTLLRLTLAGLTALTAGNGACTSASRTGPVADSPGTAPTAALDNDTATSVRPAPPPAPVTPAAAPAPAGTAAPAAAASAAAPELSGPPPRRRYLDHPKAPPSGPPPPEPPIRWERDPAVPDPRDVAADQVLAKYRLDDGSIVVIFRQEGKVIRRHIRGMSGGLRMVQEKAIDERPPGE